jgi:SH3 domain-containing YSC84-like protein 1
VKLKLIAVAAATMAVLCAQTDADKRLSESAEVLGEVMRTPDNAIPQDLLDKAQCIIVVPGMKKGAFIIGGKYGRGFALCRHSNGIGWSAPAAIRVEGGSFGFQIGGAETDVIMLVMNHRGMQKLMKSKFTLGADASVAAGPVGRETSAQTDALMNAEILTWSRQRGVFAGIALNGATLRPDSDTNEQLYHRKISNPTIVQGGVAPPPSADPLIRELDKYSSRK